MDSKKLIDYLETIDSYLSGEVVIYLYGSCAQMLLGEELRTSLDIDIAGPYCSGRLQEFRTAAEKAGLPINPGVSYQGDHIEWIGPLRLALPKPDSESDIVLWQGDRLTVRSVSPAHLIASKLIRYDASDMADIRFVIENARISYTEVCASVDELPKQFRNDPVLKDNLKSLKSDMMIWEGRNDDT